MGDFVRPEVIRLPLSGGRWIDVKKRLTAGETRKMFGRMVREMRSLADVTLEAENIAQARIVAYVVGWSLVDDHDRPVSFTADALDSVDPTLFQEILATVDVHMGTQDAARSAEKNGQAGENAPLATSPSAA